MYTLDLTEHALYVAVRDHRKRPPLGKLSQIYPHQLLILLMEMWEGESHLVKKTHISSVIMPFISSLFFQIQRPSMNQVVDVLSTYLA